MADKVNFSAARLIRILSTKRDLACVHRQKACDRPQKTSLSRPISARQSAGLAGTQIEVQALEKRPSASADGKFFDFQGRHHVRRVQPE